MRETKGYPMTVSHVLSQPYDICSNVGTENNNWTFLYW